MKRFISFVTAFVMVFVMLVSNVYFTVFATGESYTVIADTSKRSFAWPVPNSNRISSCFTDGRDHGAIDITAPKGTNIIASASGTVIEARGGCTHNYGKNYNCGCNGGCGNRVVIQHYINGTTYWTIYMHMSDIYVYTGQNVTQGDVIGTVGSTGYSEWYHLDFSIRINKIWGGINDRLDPGYYTQLPSTLVYSGSSEWCCLPYLQSISTTGGGTIDVVVPSQPILSISSGTSTSKTTFSWNACSNTDRYDLRVFTGDESQEFIYQQTTGTSISLNLPEGIGVRML